MRAQVREESQSLKDFIQSSTDNGLPSSRDQEIQIFEPKYSKPMSPAAEEDEWPLTQTENTKTNSVVVEPVIMTERL